MYHKSEDKYSNTAGTAGAHVEDTTPPEESTAPIVERLVYRCFVWEWEATE